MLLVWILGMANGLRMKLDFDCVLVFFFILPLGFCHENIFRFVIECARIGLHFQLPHLK